MATAFLCPTLAFADNTDGEEVSVSGTIVAALELTKVTDLRFAELVANAAGDPVSNPGVEIRVDDAATGAFTVIYTQNGSPDQGETLSGTGTILTNGNRSALGPAQLTVTGAPNFNYAVSVVGLGIVQATPTGFGVNFDVDPPVASQQLDGNGAGTFYVGGTMNILSATPPDDYSADIDVAVTYD